MHSVFFTLGTTEFDDLLEVLDAREFQLRLRAIMKTDRIIVQTGRSSIKPTSKVENLSISCFDFKPDLRNEMHNADLIITHCGAGTLLEILHLQKKAIGVINSKLLDNHQLELAEIMRSSGFMGVADSPADILEVLVSTDWESIVTYPDPDPDVFLNELKSLIKLG